MKEIAELSKRRTVKLRRGVVLGLVLAGLILAAAIVPLYFIAHDAKNAASDAKDAAEDSASALIILRQQQKRNNNEDERINDILKANQITMQRQHERLREILQACQADATSSECNAPFEPSSPSETNEAAERNPKPKPTHSPSPDPKPSGSPSPSPTATHSPKPPKDCFIEIGDVCADIPDIPPLGMFSLI